MREILSLYFIKMKTALFEIRELFCVICHYWGNSSFRRADFTFLRSYFWDNSFRISKHYWQSQGAKEIDVYGETPLSTLDQLIKRASITKNDHFYDLGCGRGRTLFFISEYYGATATGIEIIPYFVEKGNQIITKLGFSHCHFIQGDYTKSDLSSATLVFFYGLFMDEKEEQELMKALLTMPKGGRLITISFPIEEIDKRGLFTLVDQCVVQFNWGETEAFIQKKVV